MLNMKNFAFLTSLAISSYLASGAVLHPGEISVSCVDINISLHNDKNCLFNPTQLLIPDYWSTMANLIDESRWYGNYEKIICSPTPFWSVCAFVEGVEDSKVPGYQVKKLFKYLAPLCNKSRCGWCRVEQVDGPATMGWFQINGVEQVGGCYGICDPSECMVFFTSLKSCSHL